MMYVKCKNCNGTGKDKLFGLFQLECTRCLGHGEVYKGHFGFSVSKPPIPLPPYNESKQKEVDNVNKYYEGQEVRYTGDTDKLLGRRGFVTAFGNGYVVVKIDDVNYTLPYHSVMPLTKSDSPTKPSHYGKLDVFTYAKGHFTVDEVNAYHQITAIKYITRAGKKDGNPFEQDIKKAITHLEELLK